MFKNWWYNRTNRGLGAEFCAYKLSSSLAYDNSLNESTKFLKLAFYNVYNKYRKKIIIVPHLEDKKTNKEAAKEKNSDSVQRFVCLHLLPSQPRGRTSHQLIRIGVCIQIFWVAKHSGINHLPKHPSHRVVVRSKIQHSWSGVRFLVRTRAEVVTLVRITIWKALLTPLRWCCHKFLSTWSRWSWRYQNITRRCFPFSCGMATGVEWNHCAVGYNSLANGALRALTSCKSITLDT